jgi:DNA-binding HxlR family transcriptional regulator
MRDNLASARRFKSNGRIVTCKIQVTEVSSTVKDNMKFERSSCPITNVLDLLGDKWTLLVIRDLVLGKRRYQEFMSSPENIATNILANRLKQLQVSGLVSRRKYQQNPARYEYRLTKKGQGLEPVLEAIVVWGKKQYPGTKRFPRVGHR